MKKLLISMLAVATLASCAKEETLSFDKGEAIQFGNAFVENATRANDPSYSANDIDSLKVYGTVNGVNIYNGNKVSRDGKDYGDVWTCTGTQQYWIAGAQYKFVGIVDGDKAGVTETTVVNGMPTAINYTADGETDLLCQTIDRTAETDGTDNAIVAFNFTHLLSKVKFTVTNNTASTATRYRYTVSEIKITNANLVGDYAIPGGTWSGVTTGEYSIPDMTIASNSTVDCEAEVLLIPGTNKVGMTFNVNVQMHDGTTWKTITTYPKTYTDVKALVANNAYNFNVTVGLDDDIQFTATQSPTWDGNDTTSGIQNGYNDTTLTL